MKKKDLTEIKSRPVKDILAKVRDLEKEKVNSQVELAMAKTKNVHEMAKIKKTIAQTLTIARLKSIVDADKDKRKSQEAVNGTN